MLVTALPREWEFLLTNPVLVTALPREWEFLFEDHAPDGAWLQEVYGGSIGRKDEVSLYGIPPALGERARVIEEQARLRRIRWGGRAKTEGGSREGFIQRA